MGRVQLGQNFTQDENAKIVAFLKTLTGEQPRIGVPILPPSSDAPPRPTPFEPKKSAHRRAASGPSKPPTGGKAGTAGSTAAPQGGGRLAPWIAPLLPTDGAGPAGKARPGRAQNPMKINHLHSHPAR